MSARRRRQQAERDLVVKCVLSRDLDCRARTLVPDVACWGPLDPHEIIPRSAWGKGYLEVDNVIAVCRNHHNWIDNHPTSAHEVGLHGYSWERNR